MAIVPKSDQLNADDLIAGDKVIEIERVNAGNSEQKLVVHYVGENGRPWKPCKSMIRVLVSLWGTKGSEWVGKRVKLYLNKRVRWAGVEVGGIRISEASGIGSAVSVMITVAKGKREVYKIEPLIDENVLPFVETGSEKFDSAAESVRNGSITIEKLFSIRRFDQAGETILRAVASEL